MGQQIIKLRRSSVPGKVPDTASIDFGEIALNTHDGIAYIKKSGSNGEEIVAVGTGTSGSFTGSFFGTASWSNNSVTSSYAISATSSSYALSSSQANSAISSSYSFNSITSSYSVSSTTSSYSVSSSYSEFASQAQNATTASYVLNAVSSSYAATASSADNFTVRGTLTAQTIVVQTITSSHEVITGSLTVDGPIVANAGISGSRLDGSNYGYAEVYHASASTYGYVGVFDGGYNYNTYFDGTNYNELQVYGDKTVSLKKIEAPSFTGSLQGTSSWANNAVQSINAATASNILGGAATYVPFFDTNTTLATSSIYQISNSFSQTSIAINETNITSDNPEALYVFQTHPTSINVLTGKGNLNNYLQNNIQNTNQGVSASSDVVATANNGSETTNYIDMGINSENYSAGFIGGGNDAYLYSLANNLHIGNANDNGTHIAFFVGGSDVEANNKLQLNPNNQHKMSGSLDISGSLSTNGYISINQPLPVYDLDVSGSGRFTEGLTVSGSTVVKDYLIVQGLLSGSLIPSGSEVYDLGADSNRFRDIYLAGNTIHLGGVKLQEISGSLQIFPDPGSGLTSTAFSGSFTGSLYGTASYALTASVALNVPSTASYALQALSASFASTASYALNAQGSGFPFTGSAVITGSLVVTGSINASLGFTGSLFGTSSWANNAISTSVAISASNAISASLALTASYVLNSVNASFATTASYALNTVSASFASTASNVNQLNQNVTISGSLTLTGSAGTSLFISNADTIVFTGSIFTSGSIISTGSLNITNITSSLFGTASFANSAASASYILNAISSSFATTSSYAVSASQAQNAISSSYALNTTSASFSSTASSADNFTVRGTLTAQTIVVQTITSSIDFVTGSTRFGSSLANTHEFTGSVSVTGSLRVFGDITGTLNGTSSWAENAISSSYALSASHAQNTITSSYALSASLAQDAVTASYVTNAISASFSSTSSLPLEGIVTASVVGSTITFTKGDNSAFNVTILTATAETASYVSSSNVDGPYGKDSILSASYAVSASQANNAITASYALNAISASYSISASQSGNAITSSYAVFASQSQNAITASYVLNAISSSFATTASYAVSASHANHSTTASYALNATSASYAISASNAQNAISASFAATASSADHFNVRTALTASGLRYPTTNGADGTFIQTNDQGILSFSYVKTTIETVVNPTGVTIVRGTPLYISGSTGSNPNVYPADAANPAKMPVVYVAAFDIPAGQEGYGIILGQIDGVNTTGYPAGTEIYVAAGGGWTNVRPTGSAIIQVLGYVSKEATNGKGLVLNPGPVNLPNIQSGYVWTGDTSGLPIAIPTSSIHNVVSSSYASNATTASYALMATTASFASSIANGLNISASNISVTNNLVVNGTASFNYVYTITGSAVIIGQEYIVLNTQIPAARFAGLQIYDSGSYSTASIVWDSLTDHLIYSKSSGSVYRGGMFIAGPKNTGSLGEEPTLTQYRIPVAQGDDHIMDSQIYSSGSITSITGSLTVTSGITASLYGTASWANNSITSSYALTASLANNATTASYVLNAVSASHAQNATTASYALNAVSASFATTSSYAISASQAQNANTASYILNAVSASFATSASQAQNALTASYILNAISASFATTSSYAVSASQAQNATTASYVLNAVSASYVLSASNAQTASYILNAVSASFAVSASQAQNAVTASYILNAISASFANTSSYAVSASQAQNAVSSSYPIFATGSSIYSHNAGKISPERMVALGLNAFSGSDGTDSFIAGYEAGVGSSYDQCILIGSDAGKYSTDNGFPYGVDIVAIGPWRAGYSASNAGHSVLIGKAAGREAKDIEYSVYIGDYAGYQANNADFSIGIGNYAAYRAINVDEAIIFGESAGIDAQNSVRSIFIGSNAGGNTVSSSNSIFLGQYAGNSSSGSNNIIIGKYLSLDQGRNDSINIGGLIYGTGSYSGTSIFSGSVNGRIGINQPLPLYNLDVSGSGNYTNGLTVTGSLIAPSITGSLQGTASWANNATSSSYALSASFATSASQAQNAVTASYVLNAISASFAITASFAVSASQAQNATTASYVLNAISSSFAATASTADNFTVRGTLTAQTIVVQTITSSIEFVTGSTRFGTLLSNTHQFTGSVEITGSLNVVGAGITGSLFGTASWANNAISASQAQNAVTASYVLNAISASYALSASQAQNATTASYVLNAVSASFATSASQAQNAVTASYVLNAISSSFASTASYVLNAVSASFATSASQAQNAVTASYVLNAVSASFAATASNILGGAANYIPLWNGATTLSSSVMYQSSGNVGIGTTSPSNKLSINGATNTLTYLLIDNSQTYIGDSGVVAGGSADGNTVLQWYTGKDLYFKESGNTRLTFKSGGNVGIGITSPLYKMHVYNTAAESSLFLESGTTTQAAVYFANASNAIYNDNSTTNNLKFFVNAATRMIINSSGNVGIGTTTPNAKLDVNGNTIITGSLTATTTFTLDATLTDYATVASSVVGSNNLFTQATGSYTSAFFKYTVSSGSNTRAGEVVAAWNGTSAQFYDNSTVDIGTTTVVTSSVSIVGSDVQFNIQTNSSGWRIKSLATFI